MGRALALGLDSALGWVSALARAWESASGGGRGRAWAGRWAGRRRGRGRGRRRWGRGGRRRRGGRGGHVDIVFGAGRLAQDVGDRQADVLGAHIVEREGHGWAGAQQRR